MNSNLIARHPLTDSATHGIEMPGANHLELVDGVRIFSVLAYRGQEAAVEALLKAEAETQLRSAGPGEWLAVFYGKIARLDDTVAMVVDQSHGRTLFRLKGPDAISLLMKAVAVDIVGAGFPVGSSANMAFGHLTVNLARTAAQSFEIIVLRSFADSLYHELKLAGREFALSFAVSEN